MVVSGGAEPGLHECTACVDASQLYKDVSVSPVRSFMLSLYAY